MTIRSTLRDAPLARGLTSAAIGLGVGVLASTAHAEPLTDVPST